MPVHFGQQSPYTQPYGNIQRIQRPPRFGGEVTLQWHTVNRDIPVVFDEKTTQKPDGFVKSDVQQAIQAVENTFQYLNKTPQGSKVVLGREEADKPATIFSLFTTDFYKKTNNFLQYNPESYAQGTDQEAVTAVLKQTARHIRDSKVK